MTSSAMLTVKSPSTLYKPIPNMPAGAIGPLKFPTFSVSKTGDPTPATIPPETSPVQVATPSTIGHSGSLPGVFCCAAAGLGATRIVARVAVASEAMLHVVRSFEKILAEVGSAVPVDMIFPCASKPKKRSPYARRYIWRNPVKKIS